MLYRPNARRRLSKQELSPSFTVPSTGSLNMAASGTVSTVLDDPVCTLMITYENVFVVHGKTTILLTLKSGSPAP